MQLNMFDRFSSRPLYWLPGSKNSAAPTILRHIVGKTTEMVSPFIGSGAVELAAAANGIKVYGYDISPRLSLIWKYVIEDGERMACWCQDKMNTTSREELTEIFKFNVEITDDPFERACYFYLWQALSFRGIIVKSGTLSNYIVKDDGEAYYISQHQDRRITFLKEMAEFHNPNLTVGQGDYEETLAKHPNMFAYLDPPYPVVRGVNTLYNMEKTDEFDHKRLAEVLRDRLSDWVLSYNNHEVTRDLYPKDKFDWHYQEWNQSNSVSKKAIDEVIITPKRH